jgi:hypothetical protein
MAPFIPFAPGVRINSAPKERSIMRRSTDIVSGIVSTSEYPRAAQTYAKAIPVLPLVGSTTVIPGFNLPVRSASQIMAAPIRHLTLEAGLRLSSFASTRADNPFVMRWIWTKGVRPIDSELS